MSRSIEFFLNGYGRVLIVSDLEKDNYASLDINEHSDIINMVYIRIKDDYPEAYKALDDLYAGSDRKFRIVRRFLKCNFSLNDSTPDIDADGSLRLETVLCPMKGECRYESIICDPKYNTELSDREVQVTELLVAGYTPLEIGERLFISKYTVENHRKNIYKKLKINSISQLVTFAYKNNLTK